MIAWYFARLAMSAEAHWPGRFTDRRITASSMTAWSDLKPEQAGERHESVAHLWGKLIGPLRSDERTHAVGAPLFAKPLNDFTRRLGQDSDLIGEN